MLKVDKAPIYFFAIVGILFILGLYTLFSLRFQVGDVYPPYSSLRSDPLGTKVFYKSLANMERIHVGRNHRPITYFIGDRDTTLFMIGLDDYWMDSVDNHIHNALSNLVTAGGRLVVSFFPQQRTHEPLPNNKESTTESGENSDDKEASGEGSSEASNEGAEGASEEDSAEVPERVVERTPQEAPMEEDQNAEKRNNEKIFSLSEKWGVRIGYRTKQGQGTASLVSTRYQQSLPPSITCHTTQYFIINNNSWDVIYTQDEHPIIIEKRFGAGTIVLYADTYILSNEAMMSERHPDLLAWFVGKGKEIVFDEAHFGIRESMGIASLGHKYGLQGCFLVLLILAGLFIWKNAVPFIPPDDAPHISDKGAKLGKDHNAGLVKLLQQNIAPNDIITVCVKEWEKSVAQGKDFLQIKSNRVKEIMRTQGAQKNPIHSYRAIQKIISERK